MKTHSYIATKIAVGMMVASLVLSAPAMAKKRDNHNPNGVERISWTQLVNKLEGEGYSIRELDMKRTGWKAEVVRGGERYKLRLDAQGNVVRKKWDD